MRCGTASQWQAAEAKVRGENLTVAFLSEEVDAAADWIVVARLGLACAAIAIVVLRRPDALE